MSSTINQPALTKSMNGIITYDDGAGGSMSNGVITCNELDTQNVYAVNPANSSDIYTTNTGVVNLATNSANLNISNTYGSVEINANTTVNEGLIVLGAIGSYGNITTTTSVNTNNIAIQSGTLANLYTLFTGALYLGSICNNLILGSSATNSSLSAITNCDIGAASNYTGVGINGNQVAVGTNGTTNVNINGKTINIWSSLKTNIVSGLSTDSIQSYTAGTLVNLYTNLTGALAGIYLGTTAVKMYINSLILAIVSTTSISLDAPYTQFAPVGTPTQYMNVVASNANQMSLDFYTATTPNTSIMASQIVATGGTSTSGNGTITLNGGTTNISSTTTNISGTTTNISGTTANLTSTTTNLNSPTTILKYILNFPTTSTLNFTSSNGLYPMYDGGDKFVLLSNNQLITPANTAYGTVFVIPFSNATPWTINLKGASGDIVSGQLFRILNNGNANVTIQTNNGTNRMIGALVSRAGASSFVLATISSVMIQCIVPTGSPFNQTSANSGAYFISSA